MPECVHVSQVPSGNFVDENAVMEYVVCGKPLGNESVEMGYDLCHEHRKCSKCSHALLPIEIKKCRERGAESLICAKCHNIESLTEIRAGRATNEIVEELNIIRLLIEPNMDLSESTNMQQADIAAEQYKVFKNMNYDAVYMMHRKLVAAATAFGLFAQKHSERIKAELASRDAKIMNTAVAEARKEARPKSEKTQLSKNEKAIQLMMATTGMTREECENALNAKLRKLGKVVE